MMPIVFGLVVLALFFIGYAVLKYFKPRMVIAVKKGSLDTISDYDELASKAQVVSKGEKVEKKIQTVEKADDTMKKIVDSLDK